MNAPKNIRRPSIARYLALHELMAFVCKGFVVLCALISFGLAVGAWQELSNPHSSNFGVALAAICIALVCGAGGFVAFLDVRQKVHAAHEEIARRKLAYELATQRAREDSRAA